MHRPTLSTDFGRGLRDGDNGAPDAAHSADDGQRLRGQCEIQRGQDTHVGRPQIKHHGDAIAGTFKMLFIVIVQ